jgi:uncharacterized membrane protein (DUF106 family)
MKGTGVNPVPTVMLMSDQVINLLIQIPLAGVVVVVVVLFQKSQEKQTQQMLDFMKEQADNNREFLRTQREQNNAALARLAEEQKETREELAKITVVMSRVADVFSRPFNIDRPL